MGDRPSDIISRHFAGDAPSRLGVAVSGGGDSVALLCLLHDWAANSGTALSVATVDHALRDGSAAEAADVARICAQLDLPHDTLRWTDRPEGGNLQHEARKARLRLMADWACSQGFSDIALGHTQDDQAETVLMRLARRAGVDGLSAMSPVRRSLGVNWHRPMLEISRDALRAELRARNVKWVDDPSNTDTRFERVRARQALSELASLGIDRCALADVAAQMQRTRAALDAQVHALAVEAAQVEDGDIVLDFDALDRAPTEIRRRILTTAARWIASSTYAPRAAAVAEVATALASGQGSTVNGCQFIVEGRRVRVVREFQAVSRTRCATDQMWDRRWRLNGPENKDLEIAALGEDGIRACPDWRDTGRNRVSLLGSPALWRGDELVAAPLAGLENGWRALLDPPGGDFFTSILSH